VLQGLPKGRLLRYAVLCCAVLCMFADIIPPLNAMGFWDTFRAWSLGLLQGLPKGRLLKYDPKTKEAHVVAKVRTQRGTCLQYAVDSWRLAGPVKVKGPELFSSVAVDPTHCVLRTATADNHKQAVPFAAQLLETAGSCCLAPGNRPAGPSGWLTSPK
jgi:hypothetical protein